MKRKFRLIKSSDFKRVRRFGRSYAHPLVVLIKHPNELALSRIGISAGRSVGNAVLRNRSKRQLREAVRRLIPGIKPGWDIILLARKRATGADQSEIETTVYTLLQRACLLNEFNFN